MLYRCYECRTLTFDITCSVCGQNETTNGERHIPLDPAFYGEFQYQSKGFLKDMLGKRKQSAELDKLLKTVLIKYSEFLRPYFVNFVHISGERKVTEELQLYGPRPDGNYSDIELFKEVLLRLGFTELNEIPTLLNKLLLTTHFSSDYFGFSREMARYDQPSLHSTMKAWIEEAGTSYRPSWHLFLYYLFENQKFPEEISFNHDALLNRGTPLLTQAEVSDLKMTAEAIFFELQVERLGSKLKKFDPDQFVSIHRIDAMDGYKFEEFLVTLFQVIGFDVQETKKSGDQGADLFVSKFDQKTVIQAKNYTGNVGNSAIQQVLAAKTFYQCDHAMVVTNSYFTSAARELADSAKVELVDRASLQKYLDDYNQQLIDKV